MVSQFKHQLRNLSHKSNAFSRVYHFASEMKNRKYATMSDEEYLKLVFNRKTGRQLDLDNPMGFNEFKPYEWGRR